MGYGWELQAGALLVVENGEFRFRDKIKLTDEGGSVTDTYTFDAFGNLTSSTGDTAISTAASSTTALLGCIISVRDI